VPEAAFTAAADAYWAAVTAAAGAGLGVVARAAGPGAEGAAGAAAAAAAAERAADAQQRRCLLACTDLGLLLLRLATGGSLAADARGGGKDSNLCLAVGLAQLGAEAAACCGEDRRAALRALTRPGSSAELSAQLGLALLLLSGREWRSERARLLAACARAAGAPPGAAWPAARAHLAWFGLVEALQRCARAGEEEEKTARAGLPIPGAPPRPRAAPAAQPPPHSQALAALRDLAACLRRARELPELLDELRAAASPAEALQLLEAEEVAGGRPAEEWLERACRGDE